MAAAVESGLAGLVACGGDGTVNMALQAAVESDLPLGIIPVGTGDDIARSLGLPRKDVAAAVDVVLAGSTRHVDVGVVTTADTGRRLFLGVLSAGFDSMVNERANRMSFPRGQAKYMQPSSPSSERSPPCPTGSPSTTRARMSRACWWPSATACRTGAA